MALAKFILPGQESGAEQWRWVEGPGQVEEGGGCEGQVR